MSLHFHPLRINDIRKETNDCISICFDVPGELKEVFNFSQGQNLTIKKSFGGEEIRRNYSICSTPYDNELRIAVKKAENGRFSTFANESLKVGDVLEVLPPTGHFFTPLDVANKKNHLAIAAGSGITPIISIIKTTLIAEPQSTFTLIYGNKNRASIIFREELEGLKNKYLQRFSLIHILSRENMDIPVFSGRINSEKCRVLFDKMINLNTIDEIFICGPEELIFSTNRFLLEKGVPSKKIHFELFTTPGTIAGQLKESNTIISTGEDKNSAVSVQLDGITTNFRLSYDGDTILSAALKLGIDLPFACKGGVCSTCKAKLNEGRVEMENNYSLGEDEIANGFILTCQSHPRSEKVIVSFDER